MDRPKKRPVRLQITNQFGQRQSLDNALEQYLTIPGAKGVLLLGLGPSPAALAAAVGGQSPVDYLESPDFARQMPTSWLQEIPAHWRKISTEDLREPELLQRKALFYRPNLRLFPDFWTPVLAAKSLGTLPASQVADEKTLWMPAPQKRLLVNELSGAFAKAGMHVHALPQDLPPTVFLKQLQAHRPDFFFCINFQGLDPFGQNFAALNHLEVPVAVWCVDNPFHLLSALKSTFWQQCMLFVTDDWFINPLLSHGARRVCHLPLATDPDHFQPHKAFHDDELAQKIVFVGRSSFPDKNNFFAGCRLSRDNMAQAAEMMAQGLRPDFAWWRLRYEQTPLWPAQSVRQIGFAAEQCNLAWRTAHLAAAAEMGLTVFGDPDWRERLPANVELRPPVDYYGPLGDIYSQARFTLNLTSLLLPHGLTQRHFDVWAAGGFLLTDNTPGLRIFDQELVHEIAFAKPEEFRPLVQRLDADPISAAELRQAWQKHILAKHTYDHRVSTLLDALDLKP